MLAKDKYLKKISYLVLIFLFFFSASSLANNIDSKMLDYNSGLKNSSFLFVQSDGKTIEEGIIYIGSERIKVEYNKPQRLTIVLSKKKGMYVNHDLMEAQYFDTNKSFVKIFLKILMGENFYEKSNLKISNDRIIVKNNFEIKKKIYKVEIIYENQPIRIKKIKILENQEGFEMGFFDHNNLSSSEIDFSLINPYLN